MRAHSIIARDHTACFCMASICLVNYSAALSPRLAAAKCGDLSFAVCLLRKRPKLKAMRAPIGCAIRRARRRRPALVPPIILKPIAIKINPPPASPSSSEFLASARAMVGSWPSHDQVTAERRRPRRHSPPRRPVPLDRCRLIGPLAGCTVCKTKFREERPRMRLSKTSFGDKTSFGAMTFFGAAPAELGA